MALQPGEQASRRIRLRSTRRGYYVFESAALRAADLLGLFEIDGNVDARDVVIVYPQVYALEELGIPVREPYGALLALRGLIEDPSRIVGARDYRSGDAFRQIHWKATAHHGALQTRVCEHTSDPTAVIFRHLYARMTREAFQRGFPRQPGQTPYDYLLQLHSAFSGCRRRGQAHHRCIRRRPLR